ncbi:hypothetical protein M5X17_17750 [Paenibacillus alvei]|uniref:Uncharacterized protein n=2 Tax=Paenibacillus alvei TaxID=44250 RepID=A0ABT4GRX9_PAEAL|nr:MULTISPECIES: hypothetical protein [Paenibacillus]MCY7485131.1 hypothetical protein [Paenibacillus alvei]MCY9539700.1 hypothetical protein [Paenibacillus alvei]MCY9703223.1 hypothetical protein [Paenibacillus alvei]MCY9735557.1 hypothetical protein [Paenibacillus alvei]MCY9759449.1 hypothetical protein [Paenibacillus alvei]
MMLHIWMNIAIPVTRTSYDAHFRIYAQNGTHSVPDGALFFVDLNRVAGRRDGNLLIHTYTIERIVQLVNAAGVIEASYDFIPTLY